MSSAHVLGDADGTPQRESGLSFAAGSEVTVAAVPRHKLAAVRSMYPRAGKHYDRYELIHPIGEGGMGTVWLARMRGEHGFERLVALKLLLPSFVRNLRYRNMFIDEARIASRVMHANVAQVTDLGEHDGNLYLVMEWVNGDSLSSLLRAANLQGRAMPLTVLLRIFADVCAGLHAAHELRDQRGQPLNVVHRDVSPQNILVTDAGVVKVIDFGVVKAHGRTTEETNPGVVKGKLQYMAPERAIGADVDRRADIWTVGAILYRILAGRAAPDADGNPALIWVLVLRAQLEPLPSSIPPAVAGVVMRALARDPKDRFASAAELQEELEKLLHGSSFTAPTTTNDVAGFVSSVLGPTLAQRRAEIERALDAEEQSITLHFERPQIALVPRLPSPAPVPQVAPVAPKTLPPLRALPVRRARAAPAARPVAAPAAQPKARAGHLPLWCAAAGLAMLALAGSRPRPRSAAKPERALTVSASIPVAHEPSTSVAPATPAEPKSLAESSVVSVNDLALESELASANPEHARPASLWKSAWGTRPQQSSFLGFQPPQVLSLPAAAFSAARTPLSPATTPSSSRVEAKRAPLSAPRAPLSAPPVKVEAAAVAKSPEDAAPTAPPKCNPPYTFDRNGRKKFRPECF